MIGPNVIILVGFPGSGKSTWVKQHYDQFARLDGDALKTSVKVVKALHNELEKRRNVVVDATNVTLERRSALITEAKKYNCKIYAVVFIVSVEECIRRVKDREDKGGPHIPKIAIYKSNSTYVEPTINEGFDQIVHIKY